MNTIATTRLSSKGQIVIPEEIRKQLGLRTGNQFVVIAEDDVVLLKSISPPTMKEFDGLISKARQQAKKAGLTKQNIKSIVKKARKQ
jgi:AbrB family looped-hinge helix DNA binding protein